MCPQPQAATMNAMQEFYANATPAEQEELMMVLTEMQVTGDKYLRAPSRRPLLVEYFTPYRLA